MSTITPSEVKALHDIDFSSIQTLEEAFLLGWKSALDGDTKYDTREAARYLGTTIRTMQTWRSKKSEKQGPAYIRMSRTKIVYEKRELDAWLRMRKEID